MDNKFEELNGKILAKIDGEVGDDRMIFYTDTGEQYELYYDPDCCATCDVEDIIGNLEDLIGSPILQAEESTSNKNPLDVKPPEYQDSFTWTFYKLATVKGYVTIRWYGQSNGYYSESVSFRKKDV